jgi:hypothetical protein
MKWKIINSQTRLYISSAIILFAGLASSIFIYLTAEEVPDRVFSNEVAESMKYLHNSELYGGKANVLAEVFMKWFNGLWHGESLAYMIACIAICLSFELFFVVYLSPSDLESDVQCEKIEVEH